MVYSFCFSLYISYAHLILRRTFILSGRHHHTTKTRQKSKDYSDDEAFTKIRPPKRGNARKPKPHLSSDEEDVDLFRVERAEQGSFFRYLFLLPFSNLVLFLTK